VAFLKAYAKEKIPLPAGGLYVITDGSSGELLYQAVRNCLRAGVSVLQYRAKHASSETRLRDATVLRTLTSQVGALLIINDDIDLARRIAADGVHLGAADAPVEAARRALHHTALIGASCYNRMDLARKALAAGADYLAFGAVNPSPSKATPIRVGDELLTRAITEFTCPIVAIGGIDPETGARLWRLGVPFCAVISGIFSAPDVQKSASEYLAIYRRSYRNPSSAWDNAPR